MTGHDPDTDLLPGLMAGDAAALEAMMDRHLSRIHALAYALLGDGALAEDVAQDAFLKLWQLAPRWTPGQARILTWLRRVATNNCLDRLRRKSPIFSDRLPEMPDPSSPADRDLQHKEQAAQLEAALGQLPPRQRAAIVLSYYDDVSQRVGADIMGISEKAYEALLIRGKKALKDGLEPIRKEGAI